MKESMDPFADWLLEQGSHDVSAEFRDAFLVEGLRRISEIFDASDASWVVGRNGKWLVEASYSPSLETIGTPSADRVGSGQASQSVRSKQRVPLPDNLIADAVDAQRLVRDTDVVVAPVQNRSEIGSGDAAAIVLQGRVEPAADSMIATTAGWLAQTLGTIDGRLRQQRRVKQLRLVLEASASWQNTDDDDELLNSIADTACQLLNCERASIFLWDRRRGVLTGRPALGIEGGKLEVADDEGIVGEVLRDGEARFWTSQSDDDERVNRSVDALQNFETRSLVAVPMTGNRGKTIGVFEAINHHVGAFDALDAEVLADLSLHAAAAIESLRVKKKLTKSCDRMVDDAASTAVLIGRHASIEAVRKGARKVAPSDLAVLIRGANGTGKEVLAKNIHFQSQRRHGPFVAVNCAALVESLLESELFGHEKGAFTDAQSTRQGQFEMAHGGTLFLDEIGDMSPGGQAKLLRVLEEKVVVRVGGSQPIPVDVRVIAATNQPLEERIAEKRFREDLFFRLNVVPLNLPPLTDRGEDVLILAEHFLSQFRYQIGRSDLHLGDDAKAALIRHPWPGNVRELRNTMERVCYLAQHPTIRSADLMLRPTTPTGGASGSPLNFNDQGLVDGMSHEGSLTDATKLFQTGYIREAIETAGGNMTAAAESLGLHRSNLYRKMRQLGMPTSGE